MVKTGEDGAKRAVSKIVPTLAPGAAVTLSRADVDYVVTEYGVAALRGTPVRERVKRLAAIAHPDFKEDLIKQAHGLQIW
jgi:acyl-CoA hydrolase